MKGALFYLGLVASAFGVNVAPNTFPDPTWIVVFKNQLSTSSIGVHHSRFRPNVKFHYDMSDFRGYAAPMNQSMLELVSSSPDVAYVEADQPVHAYKEPCHKQFDATWGLDRINQRAVDLDGLYTWSLNGTDVLSYIVDTGIYTEHKDFHGRAIWGANFADKKDTDCNGHGTHVAGTVGSTTWGVAKKTTLIAVKVLNCEGSGTNAGVIAGIQYVATDAAARKARAVANMSLGGGKSNALNAAVAQAVISGVTFVVAAGNEAQDACNTSPASEPLAISVGATTVGVDGQNQIDQRAEFSNYGKCVTIFAPGELITSTWIGNPEAIETISGTSMASPHVAGAAALLLSHYPELKPSEVRKMLMEHATNRTIDLACKFTETPTSCNVSPNSLLYTSHCGQGK